MAPWITVSSANFATYGGTATGFGVAAYTSSNLLTSAGTDTVKSGAFATSTGAAYSAYALTTTGALTGSGTINVVGGGLILGGAVSPTINFGTAEGVIYGGQTISGIIQGSNGITIGGGGTTTLSGSNTFTGTITVDTATLSAGEGITGSGTLSGNSVLGAPTNPIVVNGGDINGTISAGHTLTVNAAGMLYNNPGGTIWCNIAGTGVIIDGTTNYGGGAATTIAGTNNTWSGGFLVTADIGASALTVNANSSLGTGDLTVGAYSTATLKGNTNLSSTGTTWAKADVAANGTINFQSSAPTFGNIQGAGSMVLGLNGSATNLTIGGDGSSSAFYGTISQVTGGTGSLTKQGAGTLTLAGPNTYTGGTVVSGGNLQVNGSILGPVNVGVNTLSGIGVVGGTATVATGGSVAPGAGTLTLGGLTLGNGAFLNYTLATPGVNSSSIAVASGLDASAGTTDITLSGTALAGGTYNLISYGSQLNGTGLGNFTLTGGNVVATGLDTWYSALGYDLTLQETGNTLQLQSTADATPNQWNLASGTGSWNSTSSWLHGIVPVSGATANFLGILTSAGTVDLGGQNQTVANVVFSNTAAAYTLTDGTLTLNANGGTSSTINVTGTGHAINVPVVAGNRLGIMVNPSSSLAMGGPVTVNGSTVITAEHGQQRDHQRGFRGQRARQPRHRRFHWPHLPHGRAERHRCGDGVRAPALAVRGHPRRGQRGQQLLRQQRRLHDRQQRQRFRRALDLQRADRHRQHSAGILDVTTASGGTLNLSGQITGAGGLELVGSGTVALTGAVANSYSGGTWLQPGSTLLVNNDNQPRRRPQLRGHQSDFLGRHAPPGQRREPQRQPQPGHV